MSLSLSLLVAAATLCTPSPVHTHIHNTTHYTHNTHTTHTTHVHHTHTCNTRTQHTGGTSELIREELYSIGEMFTVNCSGNLLQICLSNQCGEMHNSTYTGNVSSLSDQFKFICFADGNQVANIAYIMPDYQPIRLLQPQTQQLWPEAYDRVVIRCEATGHPAPNVSILKWDDSENDFIGVITYPNDLIAYSTSNVSYVIKGYSKFFDPGRYMCSAENLYEQRNVTVYVGEENPNNSCGTTPIPSMTPPTPVHNGKSYACHTCHSCHIVNCVAQLSHACHMTVIWCVLVLPWWGHLLYLSRHNQG